MARYAARFNKAGATYWNNIEAPTHREAAAIFAGARVRFEGETTTGWVQYFGIVDRPGSEQIAVEPARFWVETPELTGGRALVSATSPQEAAESIAGGSCYPPLGFTSPAGEDHFFDYHGRRFVVRAQ